MAILETGHAVQVSTVQRWLAQCHHSENGAWNGLQRHIETRVFEAISLGENNADLSASQGQPSGKLCPGMLSQQMRYQRRRGALSLGHARTTHMFGLSLGLIARLGPLQAAWRTSAMIQRRC